jgi:outer membrane protein OmpA-like peptidoglycan-associated protein
MKKLSWGAVAILLMTFSWNAAAFDRHYWHGEDLSWWGKGATPEPVPDTGWPSRGIGPREGYCWWWPTDPESNSGDGEPWGNRGKVYHDCPVEPVVVPPPPIPQPRSSVTGTVLFDKKKAYYLDDIGKAALDEVVAVMKRYPNDTVGVEGHAAGGEADPVGVGQRRADAVKTYLQENGIADTRISATSAGDSNPVASNDTEAGRKQNRRAYFSTVVNE